MSFSSRRVFLILNTRLIVLWLSGTFSSVFVAVFLGGFFWMVSSSLSPSSSSDQTQSPVSFLCSRPLVPGFLGLDLVILTSGLGAAFTRTDCRYFLSFALFLKNASTQSP